MAKGDSEFNEVEEFDEYNPHPYQGGYDITEKYGKPLPATPAICYPLSSASTSASAAAYTPPRVPAALPEPVPRDTPPPQQYLEPLLLPPPSVSPPLSFPIDISTGPTLPAAPDWHLANPDGNWYVGAKPWWAPGCGNSCSCCCFGGGAAKRCGDGGLWQWNAADYLFGYLPTWGPKRAETHTYANLNYAYERRRREEALLVVVEPEAQHEVVAADSWFSSDGFFPVEETRSRELLGSAHAYEKHGFEKPVSFEVQPYQPYSDASFNPVFQDEPAYRQYENRYALEWHGSDKGNADVKDEPSWPGYQYAYNSHTYPNPTSTELSAYQKDSEAPRYNQAYQEQPYQQQSLYSYALDWYNTESPVDSRTNISPSSEWTCGDSYQEQVYQYTDGCYAYKPLGSERSVSVEIPPVLSQPIYHGMYKEEVNHGRYQEDVNHSGSDGFDAYQRYTDGNSSSVYADPAESMWSLLVNGY